jgi:hypothetical protein
MSAGIGLLLKLQDAGYFARSNYDPQPIYDACNQYLGIDVSTEEGNNKLTDVINGLVKEGLITFEYSPDRDLHSKDVLDQWRISLTKTGVLAVSNSRANSAA